MKMNKPTLYLPILSFFLLLFSGSFLKMTMAQRTWCVANPITNDSALVANLDYACGHVDCHSIQQGESCFYPDTQLYHASFAMNLYYQTVGRNISACDFKKSGLISMTDPSYGSCTFISGGDLVGETDELTMGTWCVAKPGTRESMLQQNINYACNYVDCTPTYEGGECYYPTTLFNHASFAMNLYFQTNGKNESSCDFMNTGIIVRTNPSFGDCCYVLSD